MKSTIAIEKDGVIDTAFKKSLVKRTMAQIALESTARDKIDIAEKLAEEHAEIERAAWLMVMDANPEVKGKACSYDRALGLIIIHHTDAA
jgi:hypothetical protein